MGDVEILLSVHNGEKHLSQQLKSLENQRDIEWKLLVRDDGSTDSSPKILEKFKNKYGDKIRILQDGRGNIGICRSYSCLMSEASSCYVMFCDQDDVWLPEKIKKTFSRMKQLEIEKGKDIPLLVHCDLMVTDEALSVRHDSFWAYQGLNPQHASQLNRQLLTNTVTGCSMMINRPLLELAGPIPPEALIHDWWIAQTASAFGEVACIPESLVLYRQHSTNSIGAQRHTFTNFVKKLVNIMTDVRARKLFALLTEGQLRQGEAFFKRYENLLTSTQKNIFQNYFKLYSTLPFFRFGIMARNGLWKNGFLRNMAMGLIFHINKNEKYF
jgi:glycosyltransferase involved in cell wall biosynthesis